MKLKCPACGAAIDLERGERDAALEGLVKAAANFGADWELISEYLDCFRVSRESPLAPKKRLRLAREVWALWHPGRFEVNRRPYRVDREEFREALRQVCNRGLSGLANHNDLKKVLAGAAEESGAHREREFREHEAQLRSGAQVGNLGHLDLDKPPGGEELPDDPTWRQELQRLGRQLRQPGLSEEERARRKQTLEAHLAQGREMMQIRMGDDRTG